jgi:CheY-like chemotaxis protein
VSPIQPGADAAARVLLVDDNPTNRYVLGTYLRRAGHEVLEAEDGGSASRCCGRQPNCPKRQS